MSYKPERPVTSEKISKQLNELAEDRGLHGRHRWKRLFKRRLPESKGWIRGYVAYGGRFGVAISSIDDLKLEKVYLCDDADKECKALGVLEIMFKE